MMRSEDTDSALIELTTGGSTVNQGTAKWHLYKMMVL